MAVDTLTYILPSGKPIFCHFLVRWKNYRSQTVWHFNLWCDMHGLDDFCDRFTTLQSVPHPSQYGKDVLAGCWQRKVILGHQWKIILSSFSPQVLQPILLVAWPAYFSSCCSGVLCLKTRRSTVVDRPCRLPNSFHAVVPRTCDNYPAVKLSIFEVKKINNDTFCLSTR